MVDMVVARIVGREKDRRMRDVGRWRRWGRKRVGAMGWWKEWEGAEGGKMGCLHHHICRLMSSRRAHPWGEIC